MDARPPLAMVLKAVKAANDRARATEQERVRNLCRPYERLQVKNRK